MEKQTNKQRKPILDFVVKIFLSTERFYTVKTVKTKVTSHLVSTKVYFMVLLLFRESREVKSRPFENRPTDVFGSLTLSSLYVRNFKVMEEYLW